jgi:MFS family permease
MYPLDPTRLDSLRAGRWSGIGSNVFCLGLTSLLTDISGEMVASILPIYMVFALRLSPLQVGVVDGIYQGTAALAQLASGLLADRWRRHREVAAAGYALSAACKLGLLAAGNAWSALSAVIALDRFGKGIRTVPRDALISLSSAPERRGLAFGVHRAMDTAGALLGPLVAFAILALLPGAYDLVFVASFFVAIVGIAVLMLFVRNVRSVRGAVARGSPTLANAFGLLRERRFRAIVIAGSALGLVTVADSFFYLMLQRTTSMDVSLFPLLYVATALTYLLLAIPAGRLGDRIGRGRVFLLGQGLLVCACASLFASGASVFLGVLSLALLGAYYACTDGVLMAAASGLLPAPLLASGLAILTTATGLARLVASVMFGAAWDGWGIEVALALFAGGLAGAALLTSRTWMQLHTGTLASHHEHATR